MFTDVLLMFSRHFQYFSMRFSGWSGVPRLANSGYFLAIQYGPKVFSNENIVFGDPKESDDHQVSDGLKVISNESMDFNDLKKFCDPQVFVAENLFSGKKTAFSRRKNRHHLTLGGPG